jgi:carboxyl-terminal processing protease
MVILANGGSASAAEIISGAMRDHKRATVLGERTFGKGSVQELIEIDADAEVRGAVKLTTAYYYLPKGERIHGKGVEPDIIVKLTEQEQNALHQSWHQVAMVEGLPASSPTTSTAPAGQRREIVIDRQLQTALEVLRRKLSS